MSLKKDILKRIFLSLFVLLGLSILVFTVSRVIPGDPARVALGEQASEEAVARLRHQMHLDEPLYIQYGYWLSGVFRGDFGKSINTDRPVLEDIKSFFPASLELAIVAAFFMVTFSLLFGILAARFKNRWVDSLIRIGAYIGVAIPAFVLAALLILLFGYYWKVIPVIGRIGATYSVERVTGFMLIDTLLAGDISAFGDAFAHLICPAIALACGGLFQEARIIRNAMVNNLNRDFLNAHKGYGIPQRLIFRKYLLKPSLIPAVSMMAFDIAHLFTGSFLVEIIFVWPGLSRYCSNAILSKDLNAVSAVILIYGVVFAMVNLIVDIVVAYLDPRIRLGGKL